MAGAAPVNFVVPLRRAVPEDLAKAMFSREGAPRPGHKWIKRERRIVKGKLRYNYWYRTTKEAQEAAQHPLAEPPKAGKDNRKVEVFHRPISDLGKEHPHLANLAISVVEATAKALTDWLAVPRVSVKKTARYEKAHDGPYEEAEKKGDKERGLAPSSRIADAIKRLPDEIRVHLAEGRHGGNKSMTSFIVQTAEEGVARLGPKAVGYGGYFDPKTGETVINGGMRVYDEPMGQPRYMTARTLLEDCVMHEVGHAVHGALRNLSLEAAREWEKLSTGSEPKITEYAQLNVNEDFAETFGCAMDYPKALAEKCPKRYAFMRKHVLKETLPPIEQILKTPDEALAWWDKSPQTPATKLLTHLKGTAPALQFHPYHSEADQFYAVHKDGKTVYVRIGPLDADSEATWTKIPSPTDPETGLPTYDGRIGTRFRAFIKELYDEDGHPLTDNQAFFYLGQFDPEVIEVAQAAQAPEAYKEIAEHRLGQRMYLAIGTHAERQTPEKERERVRREEKRGKDPHRPGYDWAPMEISRDEFIMKSGTFAFGDLRPAPMTSKSQARWIRKENGKEVLIYDPRLKKMMPSVLVKVYEQENPDGTIAQVSVAQDNPFQIGQLINAPVERDIVDADGVTHRVRDWKNEKGDPVMVKVEGSADPVKLARKYKTTAKELLDRNGVYARGQITDPFLAALVNPNDQPIESEADLQQVLREAAKAREFSPDPFTGKPVAHGLRRWVTLQMRPLDVIAEAGSVPPIVHMQLEFDGLASPLVVGDYWAKKLGKSQIRIDELLTRRDEIKVENIRLHRPKMAKIERGALVWATDERTKKRVHAVLVEVRKDGMYVVQNVENQGAGLTKGKYIASEVAATSEFDIAGHSDIRRRVAEPMRDDVLLYMDGVPAGSTEEDPRGDIKILLPKSGRVSLEEAKRLPGVAARVGEIRMAGGQIANQELTLESGLDISRLREYLGGFVMDSRVQARLRQLAEEERMQGETLSDDIVTPQQLVLEDGTVNPEGLLGDMVLGEGGFRPGPIRIDALQKIARVGGTQYFAHSMGTGKSPLSIAAVAMLRKLRDPKTGKLHPNAVKKRVIFCGPPPTISGWMGEQKKFTTEKALLLAPSSYAGALQIPKLSEQKPGESKESYRRRALAEWKAKAEENPRFWNPFTDTSKNIVMGHEYFRDHGDTLALLDQFDGFVMDEAHKVSNPTAISAAVEKWMAKMNLRVLMSGTPIMNLLTAIPRFMRILTGGAVNLGTEGEFAERYLVDSALMRAMGAKSATKTDLNPATKGELLAKLAPYIHVATPADVIGATMPAVALDENNPAHMHGAQGWLYRGWVKALKPEELEAMSISGAVGVDEESMLSPEGRRKFSVARSIANSPGYKAVNGAEFVTYKAQVVTKDPKSGKVKVSEVSRQFTLPTLDHVLDKKTGWGGKWPKEGDYEHDPGYFAALEAQAVYLFGQDYETLAGNKIDAEILEGIASGSGYAMPTGDVWGKDGGKVRNPEYGPEGAIARGELLDEKTGKFTPLVVTYHGHAGEEKIEIPIGLKFIRDQNQKSATKYYAPDDWDERGTFEDTGEAGDVEKDRGDREDAEMDAADKEADEAAESMDEDFEAGDEVPEKEKTKTTRRAGQQGPKEGREALDVTTSPERRRERFIFDHVMTHGNAKCDEMEKRLKVLLSEGGAQPVVIFGNRTGSAVRTSEAKLRLLGYQDVNEALGHSDVSTDADKRLSEKTRKFFVTYMGVSATQGERDLNSEIFRRQLDDFGRSTGMSMFVARALGDAMGNLPKLGEVVEGWGRGHRKRIAQNFVSETKSKAGKSLGIEMPLRVGSFEEGGKVVQKYVYESEMTPKERRAFKVVEHRYYAASKQDQPKIMEEMKALLRPYWTLRLPLSDRQMRVMNNCDFMVASDAAQVGLSWAGTTKVFFYDSLFSPMAEAQRYSRATRLLPAALRGPGKPLIEKVGAYVSAREKETGFEEYEGMASALKIVREAIKEGLTPAERKKLLSLPGGAPDQVLEAWFAKRAMDKIAAMREPVSAELRARGRVPDKLSPVGEGNYIPAEAVMEVDVMNEILERLTPFDREILKSRRYLVEVQRLTVSVDMPVFEIKVDEDPVTGKKKRKKVYTGAYAVESPCLAERAQLTRGRVKGVAQERFAYDLQRAQPVKTQFDFIDVPVSSMGRFTMLPKEEEKAQKSLPAFYVLQ